MPPGKKRSPVYSYFVAEYYESGGGAVDPTKYVCVHEDNKGFPVRVAHCNTTTNLAHHLADKHGVKLNSKSGSVNAVAGVVGEASSGSDGHDGRAASAGSTMEQGRLPMYFKSHLVPLPSTHPQQQKFNDRQLDMIISTLSPAAIVGDEAYVSMIRAANPRLSVMSRSTLGRAITNRFKCHQESVRVELTGVNVCHVNSDMWTSAANEAFGSFVASWLDDGWELQTRVLRCCVVEGRHTAFAIAAFLLQVASDFGLTQKVGVVRTDGASNCVAAGGVLGDVARTRVDANQVCDLGQGGDCDTEENATVDGRGGGHATAARLAIGEDGSGPGGAENDDDEGGDGDGLPDVGSDCGDCVQADRQVPPAGGADTAADAAQARATAFCNEMPTALLDSVWQAGDSVTASSFTWQHARCATHTLQLSVRAGLAVSAVKEVLQKVRLVAKLCRTSTNFQRELRVAADSEEAAAAESGGRERVPAATLVSRLIIDCPTRWGSTLAMLCRFVRVGPAVPSALSKSYHYTQPTGRKKRVECPNQPELDALSQLITFLRMIESASTSLGSEVVDTSPMEEAVYWCVRKAGAPDGGECGALSALKRAVLADMRSRREVERLRAPIPEWFGIRVAAVLLNPFYKSSTFGDEVSTATTARATALAIIRWMVARAPTSPTEAPAGLGSGDGSPPVKRRRTFEACLRESTVPDGGAAGSGDTQVGASSGQSFPLEAEWSAYLGRVLDLESDYTALGWWRENEKHFPRVALGARYLLAIPATSVTSERVFSKAGRTVSKLRARMTGANAEEYIVLHDDITRRRRMDRARNGRVR